MKSLKPNYVAAVFFLVALQALPIQAEDVRVYDRPPSAEEVGRLLFGGQGQSSEQVSTGIKMRGINFRPKEKAPVESIPKPAQAPSRDRVEIALPIEFEYNSSEILSSSTPFLDSVGQAMNSDDAANKRLIIEGHTDAQGSDQYNLVLSRQRARAVKDYLVQNYGVSASRLVADGKGESRPLPGRDPYDQKNRRVQFYSEH
ncbi:MAG: OmpA family protein [Methylococcales bacterium]